MQRSRIRHVAGTLILGASIFGVTGAASASAPPDSAPTGTDAAGTEAPDGTGISAVARCGYAPSDTTDGALSGFGGTTPAGELTEDFFGRLCEVDPELEDLNYAPESYDAVIITALAIETAQDDGIAYVSHMNDVTRGGTKCTSFTECRDLIAAGEDIDYDGASGPLEFDGNGEPTIASYGLYTMGDNNRIDPALTRYISVTGTPAFAEDTEVVGTREGDGVLTVGTVLPQTGSLAFLGPPEFAGVELAVNELNEAGGVLGQEVVYSPGDSGDTTTDQANQTVDRLLSENADVIIGAASSSVTRTIIDKVANAGVVLFSPANTATDLSTYDDKGLYFRTAPPDIYQGDVLGQFVVGDGNLSVGIIYLNDEYGVSLTEQATNTITESGAEVVASVTYDPAATSFDSEVDQLVAADPDAVIVIGFNESSRILRTMVEKGIGPRDIRVYGCDGNIGNALGVDFDAGN
jgi:ABC-type branched-subunit amino acid transport system substrate-binding protein